MRQKINTQNYPERCSVEMPENGRLALCRCWQSKIFPYCDGAHRTYNEAHGTALGPVIVCAKTPEEKT